MIPNNWSLVTGHWSPVTGHCLLRRNGCADRGGAGAGCAVGPVVCGVGGVASVAVDAPERGDDPSGGVAAYGTFGSAPIHTRPGCAEANRWRFASAGTTHPVTSTVRAGATRPALSRSSPRGVCTSSAARIRVGTRRAAGAGTGFPYAAFIGTRPHRACRSGAGGVYASADDPAGSAAVACRLPALPCARAVRCPASIPAGGRAACVWDERAAARLWGTAALWSPTHRARAGGGATECAG
jgi:hypothetical protein